MDFGKGQTKPATSIEDWLDGRRPEHLSTNAGTQEVAFQSWRSFKEAFAPELIAQAFEETSASLGRPVRTCIDPFGGSGTTSLACQFLNVDPTTIEVNPYLSDLIEAKLSTYDLDRLIKDFDKVMTSPRPRIGKLFPNAPATFVEPGVGGRYIFTKRIARRLMSFSERIAKIRNSTNRRLFRVLLGSVSLPVSNVVVSGKGRRYRGNWQDRAVDVDKVDQLFRTAVLRAIYEIRRFQERKRKTFRILRGDARAMIPTRRKFDMAVLSPPYPNSFDYTDVYNVELWVCGYLNSAIDNRRLRLSTLRSHVQIARQFAGPKVVSATLGKTVRQLRASAAKLWNSRIPDMVEAYFADMETVLIALRKCISHNGRAYIVVGDSRYAGIRVPVAEVLAELAQKLGYTLVSNEPFRSMRASPQQGGKFDLDETLLILSPRNFVPIEKQRSAGTSTISRVQCSL